MSISDYELSEAELERERRKQQMRETILAAFQEAPYPGDDNIAASPRKDEAEEYRESLKGKHWKEVDSDAIIRTVLSPFFLTGSAFRFYLPAFLLATMDDDRDISFDFLIATLTKHPGNDQSFLERVAGMTDSEKEIVRQYLELDADIYKQIMEELGKTKPDDPNNIAEVALNSYWRNPS